jgi:hypothetical protein
MISRRWPHRSIQGDADEQEIAGQSLTTANLAEYERPMLIAAAGAAQLQCRPFDTCRSGQLEFCDEQEPRRNRPWGGGRDRRVRSAPVNFKERAGRS